MGETLNVRICERNFEVLGEANTKYWRWFQSGKWEPETFVIFDRFIHRASSYLDIGCWIGPTLFYACQLAHSAYGIEADLVAYTELAENLARNRSIASNVKILNVCAAASTGPVRIGSRSQRGDSMSSQLFGEQPDSWIVPGMRFEEILSHLEIRDCAFIKMDIEGGEYSLLPAMAPTLLEMRPTIYLSLHPLYLLISQLHKTRSADRLVLGLIERGMNDPKAHKSSYFLFRVILKCFAFVTTKRLLHLFRHYSYIYDHKGNHLTYKRLFEVSGACVSVLITDQRWSGPSPLA